MGLVDCGGCGRKVDKWAAVCPSCGRSDPGSLSWPLDVWNERFGSGASSSYAKDSIACDCGGILISPATRCPRCGKTVDEMVKEGLQVTLNKIKKIPVGNPKLDKYRNMSIDEFVSALSTPEKVREVNRLINQHGS